MVKLGFIVEGVTEKIILERSDFFNHLTSLKINFISEVIDAEGNGNLLPHNIEKYSKILETKGATDIIILTDLDKDKCFTETKKRISPAANHTVIISAKEIESWFLADTETISKFIKKADYVCAAPESIENPFQEIRSIRLNSIGIGVSTKPILAGSMVRNGFSIKKAANHANCNSAKYFLNKITQLAQTV